MPRQEPGPAGPGRDHPQPDPRGAVMRQQEPGPAGPGDQDDSGQDHEDDWA
ncbi:hypothetical protein OHV05_35490 (plasmid) [Kitasatospora sp. NBC_00070]|uniref:hypothetical protein n=1 Tax=Kitasatospora sp. NBC_00070 TaxID=2975962 RepID=UPI002F910F49